MRRRRRWRQLLVAHTPEALQVGEELPSLEAATSVDSVEVGAEVAALRGQLRRARAELDMSEAEPTASAAGFCRAVRCFLVC